MARRTRNIRERRRGERGLAFAHNMDLLGLCVQEYPRDVFGEKTVL
jgi:hypothetical protein